MRASRSHNLPKARCTSCQPISKVIRMRCAQCGLRARYSAASSTVASLQPPPPRKEPPQIRYSPDRFLLTVEMSGEFRVTIMVSRSGFAVGTKTGVELVPTVAHSTLSKFAGKVEILMTSDRRRQRLFPRARLPSSFGSSFPHTGGPASREQILWRFTARRKELARDRWGLEGAIRVLIRLTVVHAPRAQKIRRPSSGGG